MTSSVSFNAIPDSIRVPLFYAEMDNSAANTAQTEGPALIIAHPLSNATMALNTLTLMPGETKAKTMAGRGSQLARMVSAYRAVDPFGELWVIATPEPTAGVAANGKLTITSAATESGTLSVYIGSTRVQVVVVALDAAATVATALAAAINAVSDLPVTAAAAAGVVTVTAKNKGLTGNQIPITLNYYGAEGGEVTPAGLNVTITAMASGTGAPDLSAAISGLGDEMADYIAFPFSDSASLATIGAEMNDDTGRWSYARQIYGHVYTAKIGDLSTLVAFGSTLNDQHLTVAGYEPGILTAADELAAARTARAAVFLRNDPARPTQTGKINGTLPAPAGKRFILPEKQSLLTHGIATAYAESGSLFIERDITTYQKNSLGDADNSYLDSETLHTSAYVLRQLRSVITSKYARHKLANDGTRFGDGQAIVTPAVIKGELCATYRQMERDGIVENFDLFKQYLIVERNTANPNRVDVLFPPDYINQLRVLAVKNQFRLQYNEEDA
ncbi:phage tail sheath subtilisin-like domain-containing protein [Sodalis sp. RH24]|uniref:phage tail sheath subtilisin-like domain-containing protein n=1 Tax=unclassified Sodalis (in: enterobacteria) TaxID=2636512 RepID=UPI0039B52EE5